jgi:hypothetical protein
LRTAAWQQAATALFYGLAFDALAAGALGWADSADADLADLLLRQSFMKALRSSPFMPLPSLLQALIFSCWAIWAALRAAQLKGVRPANIAMKATIRENFLFIKTPIF